MENTDDRRTASLPRYLTIAEAAQVTRRSRRAIHELTRRGAIPLRKLPRSSRIVIPADELVAWMDGAPLEVVDGADGSRVVRAVMAP